MAASEAPSDNSMDHPLFHIWPFCNGNDDVNEYDEENMESDIEVKEFSATLYIKDFTCHTHVKVGRYYYGKNGFYHAFRQGLAKLGTTATVSELKSKCKEFAANNPPSWFLESLINQKQRDNSMTQNVIEGYVSGMDTKVGHPAREGRLLCQLYRIKLYMLHAYGSPLYISSVIDGSGVGYSNIIDSKHPRRIYMVHREHERYQTASIDESMNHMVKSTPTTAKKQYLNSCLDVSHQGEGSETDTTLINKKRNEILQTKLNELQNAIIEGNIGCIENIDLFLHDNYVLDIIPLDDFDVREKSLTKNQLIVLACMHKRAEILYYLLHKTTLLYFLAQESSNTGLEYEERLEAFRYAMCSDNFNLVELLYDNWSRSMHGPRRNSYDDDDVIHELEKLNRLLNKACDLCKDELLQNCRMQVEVHCLVKFNAYQINLYTELRDLKSKFDYSDKSKEGETERQRLLVHKILSVHEIHLNVNDILINDNFKDIINDGNFLLSDDISHIKNVVYLGYEVYFRKLDFNVSLFLLDNLHVLKKRLVTPEQSYQKLECALYHYIYRASEYWRMYLQDYRKEKVHLNKFGLFKGLISKEESIHEKLVNGTVLFLERRQFQKALSEFKIVLETINIKNNVRNENIPNDEMNCLTLLPYMRDEYSLTKITNYIFTVFRVDLKQDGRFGRLIIERVIQVLGEMFKTSDESLHLSLATKSLLQTIVSDDELRILESLRTALSHAEDGQLTKRIKIENTEGDLFEHVKTDLEAILHRIISGIKIHHTILDKSIINKGIGLLKKRLDELLPHPVQILHKDGILNNEVIMTNPALQQNKESIFLINNNLKPLKIRSDYISFHTKCILLATLPKYFEIIENKLTIIKDNNELWRCTKLELPIFDINLADHPTDKDKEKVTNTLRRLNKKGQHIDDKLIEKISLIKDNKRDWESIKEFLRFLFEDVQIFGYNCPEVTKRCLSLICLIRNSSPSDTAITHVYEYIDIINREMNLYYKNDEPLILEYAPEPHQFKGIEDLMKLLDVGKCDNNQQGSDKNNIKTKRALLFEGLSDRIDLLKIAMDYPKKILLSKHIMRYECDPKFRIVIEILLADIMSVFKACKIDSLLIKSSNLLTEINLRNVLDHANPFLEVIGDALALREFQTELLNWARSILDDSASIEALHSLFKENIDYSAIKNDSRENMTTQQQKWLEVFKQSNKWQEYLKLIPESRRVQTQNIITPPNPNTANEEALVKLIAAVQNKEIDNVLLLINEANMDLVDRHGKAAVHYAAMKGHIDILQVLLQNGAKANVADGTNGMRPLHYAARNGMAAAVNMLFHYGADTTVEDNHNRLPLYYVNRNNHELAEQLARQLTVQMGFHLSVYTNNKLTSK